MKFIITESKRTRLAINWLNNNYGDLIPYETKKYPNIIFFMKDGEVIFDYHKKNKKSGISYDKIWFFLQNFFGFDYEEIQDITNQWIEEHYKVRATMTTAVINVDIAGWKNITN